MSRPDSVGLFWQDIPTPKGQRAINRIMPEIPQTGWRAPRDFPNLFNVPYLSIDCETKDPNLPDRGPGWGRGDGHIVGFSVSVWDRAWYFPMRHEVCPEENLDPTHCLAWLRDTMLAHGTKPVEGANLMYDIGWLGEEDIHVRGPAYDVQFAEALLSEAGETNLDFLGRKYLGGGKVSNVLYQWCADYYGGPPTEKQRANIYRSPPSLVGPYAETDALLPARILPFQWEALQREGLVELFEMETGLIPLLIAMRRGGVSVDIPRAEYVGHELGKNVALLNRELKEMVGFEVNVNANDSLQKLFRHLSLSFPLDAQTGKPSFTKDTLPKVEHPVAEMILTIRKREKIKSTFIESYILESHVNGKIFCSLHPLRGDDGGARSGRFSMSKPNGQNIPSRDEELAPLVRSFFIPHPGHKRWRRYDYDQIEYRELAHFAVGPGSDGLRLQYITDPKTDYHVNTQKLVTQYTGVEIPRKPIKNFNFGMTFGMGKGKMVRATTTELKKLSSGFKLDADALYDAYHEAAPWTKATLEACAEEARRMGFITTILGRRSRFDLWEPDNTKYGEDRGVALPYMAALSKYGRVKRAYLHKALNRKLQGSAADMLKMAMLKMWRSGVFSYTGVPGLTVHDELDFSDPLENENDEAWRYIQHTMENAIPHRIPIIASLDVGANWGACT